MKKKIIVILIIILIILVVIFVYTRFLNMQIDNEEEVTLNSINGIVYDISDSDITIKYINNI